MKKVALITGGSRGIGLGIAKSLASMGCHLAINGMRSENLVSSLNDLRTYGVEVVYCRGDIGTEIGRKTVMSEAMSHFGYVNILVNNAGAAPKERKDLLDISEKEYDRVMDVNLKSTFFLSQMAAKDMIRRKNVNPDFQAFIINISSISASVVSINRGQYCISKAGMSMVTKLFAARLGEVNIPVYEIRPGIIETDMTSGVKDKYDKLIAEGLCVTSRWGYPEDVGRVVASLVRGDFLYSTGQVIMVDGGLTISRL